MAGLPEDIESFLDEVYGPVVATFTIEKTPQGGAPEEIRKDWLGIGLPVRAENLSARALAQTIYFDQLRGRTIENDDPVAVTGIDAVHALEQAGRESAAQFWAAAQLASLVFRAHEGKLVVDDPQSEE